MTPRTLLCSLPINSLLATGCVTYGTVADEIRTECESDLDAVEDRVLAAEARVRQLETELAWVRSGRDQALGELAELEAVLQVDDAARLDADLVVNGALTATEADLGTVRADVVFTDQADWLSSDSGTPLFTAEPSSTWLVSINEITRAGAPVDSAGVYALSVSNAGACVLNRLSYDSDVRVLCAGSTTNVVAESDQGQTSARIQWLRIE